MTGVDIIDADELPESYDDELAEKLDRGYFLRDDLISVVEELIKDTLGSIHWN